jgi:NAD-dependent SIR2 family protein deacetylase
MFNRPESERHTGGSIAAYATFRSEAGGFHDFPNAAKENFGHVAAAAGFRRREKRQFWSLCQTLGSNQVG